MPAAVSSAGVGDGRAVFLIGIDADLLVDEMHFPRFDRYRARRRSRASGANVETAAVKRALDFATINISFGQRPGTMRTGIGDREVFFA
jgi:hypothetical protein